MERVFFCRLSSVGEIPLIGIMSIAAMSIREEWHRYTDRSRKGRCSRAERGMIRIGFDSDLERYSRTALRSSNRYLLIGSRIASIGICYDELDRPETSRWESEVIEIGTGSCFLFQGDCIHEGPLVPERRTEVSYGVSGEIIYRFCIIGKNSNLLRRGCGSMFFIEYLDDRSEIRGSSITIFEATHIDGKNLGCHRHKFLTGDVFIRGDLPIIIGSEQFSFDCFLSVAIPVGIDILKGHLFFVGTTIERFVPESRLTQEHRCRLYTSDAVAWTERNFREALSILTLCPSRSIERVTADDLLFFCVGYTVEVLILLEDIDKWIGIVVEDIIYTRRDAFATAYSDRDTHKFIT